MNDQLYEGLVILAA